MDLGDKRQIASFVNRNGRVGGWYNFEILKFFRKRRKKKLLHHDKDIFLEAVLGQND